jgi:hypothetical protein
MCSLMSFMGRPAAQTEHSFELQSLHLCWVHQQGRSIVQRSSCSALAVMQGCTPHEHCLLRKEFHCDGDKCRKGGDFVPAERTCAT